MNNSLHNSLEQQRKQARANSYPPLCYTWKMIRVFWKLGEPQILLTITLSWMRKGFKISALFQPGFIANQFHWLIYRIDSVMQKLTQLKNSPC